jgi:hypothetical protein
MLQDLLEYLFDVRFKVFNVRNLVVDDVVGRGGRFRGSHTQPATGFAVGNVMSASLKLHPRLKEHFVNNY